MKISIIVPVYNAELYLEECILSVIKQTNENWELILVDDGSKDESGEICDFYALHYKDKIKVFHKQNEGQFLTRQHGIKRCTGEYVGFLDADDTLALNYVDSILKCVEQNNNPDVICFEFIEKNYSSLKLYNLPQTDGINIFSNAEERKRVYEHIISGDLSGSMCSKAFKADFIKDIKIENEEVCIKKYGEDSYQSIYLLAVATTITFLRETLYFYRMNENGASKGFSDRELDYFSTQYVFKLINDNLPKWAMDNDEYKSLLHARIFNETVYYMLNYYRSAKGFRARKKVVDYDWTTYLLEETKETLLRNEYIRTSYVKVWKAFQRHAYMEIFFRETFKKFIGW